MANIIIVDGTRLEYDTANYALNIFFMLHSEMDGMDAGMSKTIALREHPLDRDSPVDVLRIRHDSTLALHLDPSDDEHVGSVGNIQTNLDSQMRMLMTDWEGDFPFHSTGDA